MNYYIADMHLFCKSQTQEGRLNFDNRPFQNTEEMHQHFLEEWNKQITCACTAKMMELTDMKTPGTVDQTVPGVFKGKKRGKKMKKKIEIIYVNYIIYEEI